jgi:hypothetical protein
MAEHVDCPVCYEEIVDHPAPPGKKATGSTKTSCGHAFHPGCLATWYAKHSECPYCRAEATEFERPTPPAQRDNEMMAILNAQANATHIITNDDILFSQLDMQANAVNQTLYNLNYFNNLIPYNYDIIQIAE